MTSKILLVDDEELVTEALERLFHGEGLEPLTASSAESAFAILEREDIDVIISDQRMPGLNGVEFLTLTRKLYPDAIRIMLTGYATVESALRAINEGEVYRLFLKPCDFSVLKRVVLEALEAKAADQRTSQLEQINARQASRIASLEARCAELEKRADGQVGPRLLPAS